MAARIIDGKLLADRTKDALLSRVRVLRERGIEPCLAVILVGSDPASTSYVTSKERDCAEIGIRSLDCRHPESMPQAELLSLISRLNADPTVHGILVQLPLPAHIDQKAVIAAISPEKDVDGFTPINVGRLVIGEPCYLPCTPHGVMRMIAMAGVETRGAKAVVLGRSNIVGKPLANLLVRREYNATVTVCHTATRDMAAEARQADILIACAGVAGLVKADMVKPGACVIDVGINRVADPTRKSGHRLVGDVDFASVEPVAGSLSPVPGGVGPMTRAMLLENTVLSAEGAVYARSSD